MRLVIVGGGISGLSLAYFLLKQKPSLEVTVLESEKKAGGKIWTDKANGFLCEGGVNGFLDNRPRTLELAAELALAPLRSNDTARKRYIFSDNKLHTLPDSPGSFFSSNLLSLFGRLRVVSEIFVPRGRKDEESLAEFAQRRLGNEAYEKLIDPMASGIYAGDPEKMSLKSCFPRIYELEKQYGSLIKAMIKLQKEAKKTGKKVGVGPGGVLTSFSQGMETFTHALTIFLGNRLQTDSQIVSMDKKRDTYEIYFSTGSCIEAETVVIATPAYEASRIVNNIDKHLSSVLKEIFYPAISVVCLGYRQEKIKKPIDGFGFLVPKKERKKMLGTLWDSSIFPNRAPEGYVLLRTMLGGVRMSDIAMENEDRLTTIVIDELNNIMNINAEPDFVKVFKHKKGIPQYFLGHQKRLESITNLVNNFNGLYLTGNAYRGIGVNDCIENSFLLAERIVKEI